ncbi:hypothetical protein ACFE04_012950 [Oxalis oulophora]
MAIEGKEISKSKGVDKETSTKKGSYDGDGREKQGPEQSITGGAKCQESQILRIPNFGEKDNLFIVVAINLAKGASGYCPLPIELFNKKECHLGLKRRHSPEKGLDSCRPDPGDSVASRTRMRNPKQVVRQKFIRLGKQQQGTQAEDVGTCRL